MGNQIRHNIPNSVVSAFNPIISLEESIRKKVNHNFIDVIAQFFFESVKLPYEFLNTDIFKTDVEFINDKNYVHKYLYKHVVTNILKETKGYDGKINYRDLHL